MRLYDRLRGSLQAKFLGATFVILLVVPLAASLLISANERSLLLSSLRNKGTSMAAYIATLSKEPLVSSDNLALDSIVREVNNDPEVAYAIVFNKTGKAMTTYYSSINQQIAQLKPALAGLPEDAEPPAAAAAIKAAGLAFEVEVPVVYEEETIGRVTLGVTSFRIAGEIARSAAFVFLANFGLALLLLGGSIFLLSRRLIIRPVVSMMEYAVRISRGDLSTDLAVTSADEMGRLMEGLNSMTGSLRGIVRSINDSFASLEQASKDLGGVSVRVSDVSSRQAQSIDEASSSIEEMNAIIRDVAASVETLFSTAEETTASILEMSASINQVAANAELLSANVGDSSSLITEMAASIKQVAGNVENLSAMVTQVSASISQIASSTSNIERNAGEMSRLSGQVAESVSGEGRAAVQSAVEGIRRIKSVVDDSVETIRSLGGKSSDIGEILTVITGIADQINLLALNASIIAAQAGEHGRGFAVVADEIRGLAERTTSSIREIGDLIGGVRKDITSASRSMGQVTESVETGVRLVENIEKTLLMVAEHTRKALDASLSIANATAEQARGTKQVSESAESISSMTVQIARAMQEQARGTERITAAVAAMHDLSAQVKKATVDQSKGAKQIASASESSTAMAQGLLRSAKEEAKGSEAILSSILLIRETTTTLLAAVEQMEGTVAKLSTQSQALTARIDEFKLGD